MKKDLAWLKFRDYLNSQMAAGQVGPSEVAVRLGSFVTDRDVTNWRAGRTTPALGSLADICRAVDGDLFRLLATMNVVPLDPASSDLANLVREVIELRHEKTRLTEILAQRSHEDLLGQLVSEAARSTKWAIAVWPAWEGPNGFESLVAFRVSFRRIDGGPPSQRELTDDFGFHLRDLYAFSALSRSQGWPSVDSDELRISVPVLTAPRPPANRLLRAASGPRLRTMSIAVLSQTLHAWTSDVAAHVADYLGLGLMSTRDAVAQSTAPGFVPTMSVQERDRRRANLARTLLSDPPADYVWYHFATTQGDSDPLLHLPPCPPTGPKTLIVRLRETDSLIEEAVMVKQRSDDDASAMRRRLRRQRAAVDDALYRQGAGVVSIDVDTVDDSGDVRTAKAERSLNVAANIVEQLAGHIEPQRAVRDSMLGRWRNTRGR